MFTIEVLVHDKRSNKKRKWTKRLTILGINPMPIMAKWASPKILFLRKMTARISLFQLLKIRNLSLYCSNRDRCWNSIWLRFLLWIANTARKTKWKLDVDMLFYEFNSWWLILTCLASKSIFCGWVSMNLTKSSPTPFITGIKDLIWN